MTSELHPSDNVKPVPACNQPVSELLRDPAATGMFLQALSQSTDSCSCDIRRLEMELRNQTEQIQNVVFQITAAGTIESQPARASAGIMASATDVGFSTAECMTKIDKCEVEHRSRFDGIAKEFKAIRNQLSTRHAAEQKAFKVLHDACAQQACQIQDVKDSQGKMKRSIEMVESIWRVIESMQTKMTSVEDKADDAAAANETLEEEIKRQRLLYRVAQVSLATGGEAQGMGRKPMRQQSRKLPAVCPSPIRVLPHISHSATMPASLSDV